MIDDKDIPSARPPEIPSGKQVLDNLKQQIQSTNLSEVRMPLPNNYGVENFVKLIDLAGNTYTKVYEAMADDGKVSLMEGLMMGIALAPKAFGLISAIPQIPNELGYEQITDDEFQLIANQIQESFVYLKGDTKQASKEFVKWILDGRDLALRWIITAPDAE